MLTGGNNSKENTRSQSLKLYHIYVKYDNICYQYYWIFDYDALFIMLTYISYYKFFKDF